MGNSHDENEYLGKERHAVPDGEVVVHGAEITCKYGSGGSKPNYLLIEDGHGIMADGKHCAHDGNCIPMKNINPFDHCTTSNAKTVLTALAPNASGDLKERCNAALKVIKANEIALEADGIVNLVPCALPLLDRWFDADEKEIVLDSFEMGSKIIGDIEALQKEMSKSLQKGEKFNRSIYDNAVFVSSNYTIEERAECLQISKDLNAANVDIKKKCSTVTQL